MDKYYGTGRRKKAIAKVWLSKGSGKFTVNDIEARTLFNRLAHQHLIYGPLKEVGMEEQVDVKAVTLGGGISGQAGALRMGIARALIEMDATLREKLRAGGHVTRDPRMKESKKYGQPGARKNFQFSKR